MELHLKGVDFKAMVGETKVQMNGAEIKFDSNALTVDLLKKIAKDEHGCEIHEADGSDCHDECERDHIDPPEGVNAEKIYIL